MARINLLDWRQARRERRQKSFLTSLGLTVAAAAGIVFLMISYVNGGIEYQNARNAKIKQEIAAIDEKIKEIKELEKLKGDLLARMKIVEQLQQSRSQMVHFFDEIVTTLPEGVYLTSIQQKGDKTKIDGIAESNGRVSTYIRNLDRSPWFNDPQLVVIKTTSNSPRRQSAFTLNVKLAAKSKRDSDDEEELE